MIDLFGGVLGVAGGPEEEPQRAGVRREGELLRERGVGAQDRRLALGRRRAHDEDVRREQAEDGAAVAAGLVVDVDPVAARDVADEAAGAGDRDRDRPLLAR